MSNCVHINLPKAPSSKLDSFRYRLILISVNPINNTEKFSHKVCKACQSLANLTWKLQGSDRDLEWSQEQNMVSQRVSAMLVDECCVHWSLLAEEIETGLLFGESLLSALSSQSFPRLQPLSSPLHCTRISAIASTTSIEPSIYIYMTPICSWSERYIVSQQLVHSCSNPRRREEAFFSILLNMCAARSQYGPPNP